MNDSKPDLSPDELLQIYTDALVCAQIVRTPEAWAAVGEVWGAYFEKLMASPAGDHRTLKDSLAARCRAWGRP